jgi:O-antigen ligase/polysaccharide polymerase Wzy-like membrane protein
VIERLTKVATLAAVGLAIPLHLFVDPAGGWPIRVLAIVMFGGAFLGARRWPSGAPAAAMALLPLGPALLTRLLHVAALNVFYTVLLAAVLGATLARIPRDRWALPRWWALLLGTWALTLALGWPVMIVREAGLRLDTLRDVGALDTWAMLTTPQVESWILYVVITQLVGVLWLDWLFANEPDPGSRIPDPVKGLLIGATLASLVAIYQGTVNIAFLSGGVWPGLRRAAGTLLDANAYGIVAAFAGPLAFVSIPSLRLRHARTAQAAALAVNWAGAWMSGSRTAFVCGACGTLLLVYELLRTSKRAGEKARDTSSLLAGIVAMVLVLIGVAGAIGPFSRMAAGASIPFADLWSRGGYGTVALRMIRDYPLTGVGIGSFNWMATDYWRLIAHDRLPFDNAQNWWRHQVVELGIVGSLPLIAWSLLIAWLVFTRRSPAANRVETATLRGLLIGVGLASMLGVPTQNPIALLIFFYLVARFEHLTNPRTPNPRTPNPRTPNPEPPNPEPPNPRTQSTLWLAGALIAAVYASGQLVLAHGTLKPVARAERTNRDYIIGTYPGERLPQGSFRWTRKRATFALSVPSRYLSIRFHVAHPDVGTHPVRLRVTTPCQTLVDEVLTDAEVHSGAFELPEGQSRVVFDTEVSRTWRPADFGNADPRELGVAVEADFVGTRDVVASQGRWIPLKPCAPV